MRKVYCKSCDKFLFKKFRKRAFLKKRKLCKACERIAVEFSTKMQNEYHKVFPVTDDMRKLWKIGRSLNVNIQEIKQKLF